MMNTRDHYDILGVGRDASASEVRARYLVLAKQNHPDLNSGSSSNPREVEARFQQVKHAYESIMKERGEEKGEERRCSSSSSNNNSNNNHHRPGFEEWSTYWQQRIYHHQRRDDERVNINRELFTEYVRMTRGSLSSSSPSSSSSVASFVPGTSDPNGLIFAAQEAALYRFRTVAREERVRHAQAIRLRDALLHGSLKWKSSPSFVRQDVAVLGLTVGIVMWTFFSFKHQVEEASSKTPTKPERRRAQKSSELR